MKQVLKIISTGFETYENESGIDKVKLNRVARLLNNRFRSMGATSSKLNVNHVDISGFIQFEYDFYYISLFNIGWSVCDSVLFRTAQNNKDFTGGANHFIKLDDNLLENIQSLIN